MPSRVENIVRKGEIACHKQFPLLSQCFPQLYIFSASKCYNGDGWAFCSQQADLAVHFQQNSSMVMNCMKLENSLPGDKVFEDHKFNDTENIKFVFHWVENVRNGENGSLKHFLLFSINFSKAVLFRVRKTWDCLVKCCILNLVITYKDVDRGGAGAAFATPILSVGMACRTNKIKE